MEKNNWAKIEALFHAARVLSRSQRSIFLDEECEGDRAMRDSVESLLKHADKETELDEVVEKAAHSLVHAEQDLTGKRIGSYQITATLGKGGMGSVYLAHRADEQYQKQVAIKLIKHAAATKELMQRFRIERQILARLEHPYIARLLDGGTTEAGLPYLVMEYVEGESIDDYCNLRQLTINQRLSLFRKICSAVQYAHQKLIVHRDLKPSNILVTKDGNPKLLDFGIAKFLDKTESDFDAIETQHNERLLTPRYSSPEQIKGEPVSTVTDVYALGIILYELLTGKRPYGIEETSRFSIEKAVLETSPLLPSTSITQLDDNSNINEKTGEQDGKLLWCGELRPKQLKRLLSGDLDNIVMMALRKEPEQRYVSVEQFSRDIEYFLHNKPVHARPLSLFYLSTRFVQRNFLSSSLTVILVISIIGFSVTTLMQSKKVEAERAKAVAIVNFLTDMFSEIEPDKAQGKEVSVREVLDKAAKQLDDKNHSLTNERLLEAAIRRVIGQIYSDLGILPAAEKQLESALRIHRETGQQNQPEFLLNLIDLSGVYHLQIRENERQKLNLEALPLSKKLHGDNHQITIGILHNLAGVFHMNGNFNEAKKLYSEVLKKRRLILGENHQDTLSTIMSLGTVYHWSGDYEKAENHYQLCLDKSRVIHGESHSQTLICMSALGSVLETAGHYKRAEPIISEHIKKARLILGNEHPETLRSMHNLADVYRGLGRYEESENLFLETLALRKKTLGNDHIETLQTRMKLARLYRLIKRYSEGIRLVEYTVKRQTEKLGFEHPTTLIAAQVMADLYREDNQLAKAIELYDSVLIVREKVLGEQHAEIIDTLAGTGLAFLASGNNAQAESYLLQASKLADANPKFKSLNLPLLQKSLAQ